MLEVCHIAADLSNRAGIKKICGTVLMLLPACGRIAAL
jgi:hypothetical protein